MQKYLFPDLYVETVLDLPLDKLYEIGIRAFILDLDNTVTEWNSMEVRSEIVIWLNQIKEGGFQACIASNNGKERVVAVAEKLGIPFVSKAGKPRRKAFVRALDVMQAEPAETAVVGDQVFTDILGGNRMNLFTILVVPINSHEFFGTQIVRRFERFVLWRIRRAITKGKVNSMLD